MLVILQLLISATYFAGTYSYSISSLKFARMVTKVEGRKVSDQYNNGNDDFSTIKEPKNFAAKTILGQNIINCRSFSLDSQKSFEFLGSYKSYKQVFNLI